MTDTPTTAQTAAFQFMAMLDSMREVIARDEMGFDKRIVVTAEPEALELTMDAAGNAIVTNGYKFSLDDRSTVITGEELDLIAEGGGNFRTLLASRLSSIHGYIALNNGELIRALLARLGGEVKLTFEEVLACRQPSTIQFDGLKVMLTA